MDDTTPQATRELIAKLQQMHPEHTWGTVEIGDYDQNADLGAPDVLICFSNDTIYLCDTIVDPYSTFYSEECEPSRWGISVKAAELIRTHNLIYLAKYDERTSPYFLAQQQKK
jgi:hypothetical protein